MEDFYGKAIVLIVAKCNVNKEILEIFAITVKVLIVAKCNVNNFKSILIPPFLLVLIVAKCNVNHSLRKTSINLLAY